MYKFKQTKVKYFISRIVDFISSLLNVTASVNLKRNIFNHVTRLSDPRKTPNYYLLKSQKNMYI